MFTLFQYLHCPYCVRADMVANYSGLPHKKVLLLNDDEATCINLVGVKMVPILQTSDGSAMGESLDIVAKILTLAPEDKQLLPAGYASTVTEHITKYSSAISRLLYPRNLMIAQPEFETQSARDYFQRKKEAMLGCSFNEAFANSETYLSQVNAMLAELPALTPPSARGNQLSWDDVYIFPSLRNLTMVKGLSWPAAVKDYVDEIAKLTNIHLYSDQAV
ncbi:glutaredoxin 2 [Aestuariibacter sp. GS-14]|uniref:glutaredoxin 2 n=1 Tax=Aestuariibacter sp. GS-14 TaxID=2590670 RepID=UPI0015E831D6|nr:glutaredoxin 2 [Aestuariibacter sp. GS-14]